jgi:phage tail sheath protein FI
MRRWISAEGVWKAPANVSLASVVRPAVPISNQQQEDLNAPSSGKSVNAIREFTGRGVLVWGARTLAGNDNEWRYVPVRRLAIFVEASIKKALLPFVFEPNDASTWTAIQAMTTNFLLEIWKQGGLMGAKPEDAFSVQDWPGCYHDESRHKRRPPGDACTASGGPPRGVYYPAI